MVHENTHERYGIIITVQQNIVVAKQKGSRGEFGITGIWD
jgi:hypothetical protein